MSPHRRRLLAVGRGRRHHAGGNEGAQARWIAVVTGAEPRHDLVEAAEPVGERRGRWLSGEEHLKAEAVEGERLRHDARADEQLAQSRLAAERDARRSADRPQRGNGLEDVAERPRVNDENAPLASAHGPVARRRFLAEGSE